MRSFIAINLDAALRTSVGRTVEALRSTGADVKWVAQENLHITVKFLGEIDPLLAEQAGEQLRSLCSARRRFELGFHGAGAFPDLRRPRIVWIGLTVPESLDDLHQAVEASLEPLGLPREPRKFSPHLTIGRVRSPRCGKELRVALEGLADRVFGNIEVRSLALMKSDLKPTGPVYSTIQEYHLKEGS